MRSSWNDIYYEALEFYYWEPQHLGRKKPTNPMFKTSAEALKHLRKIEVPLNHQLKQFFSIAPNALRSQFFTLALGLPILGKFTMLGRNADIDYILKSGIQPDFLFRTEDNTVSVEMKIDSKCSAEQVLKYALVALAVEIDGGGRRMQHSLIVMGKSDFNRVWKERYSSPEELRIVLESQMQMFLAKRPTCFREEEVRFFDIVKSLSIGFVSYRNFAGLLSAEKERLDSSEESEAYRNLLNGMISELEERELI